MRKLMMVGLLGLAPATAAYAAPAPTITYVNQNYGIPSYTTATIFETFNGTGGTVGGAGTPFASGQGSGSYVESSTGTVNSYTGSVPGAAVAPGSPDKYLAIENGSFTVNLGTGVQVFSFIFGSLDSYNSLALTFTDGLTQTFTGAGIINQPVVFDSNGNSSASGTNAVSGRVTFDANGGPAIKTAVFSSGSAAFEIDDLAAAAPEPAAWALMILGFGLVGTQLRSRRRKVSVSFA